MSLAHLFQLMQLYGNIKETVHSFKTNKKPRQQRFNQRHLPNRPPIKRQRGFWI